MIPGVKYYGPCDVSNETCQATIFQVVTTLRWPEPIYMRVGYVFESRFSAGKNLTDFYDFWHN